MSLANMVRRMTEAGAPPEAIAIALEEIEVIQTALDARRAADRDRKREQRERQKTANVTGRSEHVTGQSADIVPLNKNPPDPQKLNPSVCVSDSSPRARGYHRLPEGWRPTRRLPANTQAKADQWPPGTLENELASFHRWAANAKDENGKGRKLDWDKAWVNWIERRHDERHGRTNSLGRTGASPDGLSPTTRAAIAVFGAPTGH